MFPYTNSSSSTTAEGPYSFPFFQFPCPFMEDLDDDGLLGLPQQNHNLGTALHSNPLSHERISVASSNMMMSSVNGDGDGVGLVYKKKRYEEKEEVPWKKIGKRDRHSKICTAQGLRDRRMRLSVKVARKFFDLQDMLDFDKASKTIEWLLINSEPAIQQLARTSNHNHFSAADKSMSSSSEVVSESNIKETESLTQETKKKARPPIRIAKESRDKARARARDRTRHKIKLRISKQATSKDSGCGANEFPGFTGNINEARMEPAYAMTSKKASLGNNGQEHSSILMTISNGGPWNPSSLFWTTPNAQDPIPNSIFMNTNALELGIPSPLFTSSNSNSNNIGGTHFL